MATTRPAAQSTIIKRPRLTKLLDDSEARILLLCAPAGYGKTTLAREWTETLDGPVAWYRGGIEMLDSAAVALGLIEVLRGLGLADADAVRLSARAARDNRALELGRAIGAAVAAVPEGSVLVIDDYHHAESSESEALIGAFADETALRILITSRTRPSWLSSRMQVYGDAFILGSDELAFTDDEATTVLASDPAARPASFVAQARGWPVIIGLAARQRDVSPVRTESLLPSELYEYFAEDLLTRASAARQERLYLLALAGGTDIHVTQELLGDGSATYLTEAADGGFVTRVSGLQFEMHPLLQAFLLARLHEQDDAKVQHLVGRALRSLGRARRWDDCLAALAEFPGMTLATSLLEEALYDLLDSRRIATIKRWLSLLPHALDGDSAVPLLAEAEIAVREGDDTRAKVLAEQAADISVGERAARSHLVAARAAHMLCDDAGTLRNAERAVSLTKLSRIRDQARKLELMNALEGEKSTAYDLLELVRAESQRTPERGLLLSQATGLLRFSADCDVRRAVRELEAGLGLMPHVSEPLQRTGFLNVLVTVLFWLAEYERSLEISGLQIEDARTAGLDFVVEHARTTRAGALVGLRKLGLAQKVLNELDAHPSTSPFIANESALQWARLKTAAGDLERAELLLRGAPGNSGVTRASHGERYALRGLLLAAMGELSAARSAVREAKRVSTYVQTRSFGDLALVIVDLQEQPARADREAIARMIRLGQLDPLVVACRAYPPLAKWAAADERLASDLTGILASSRDVDIARSAGLAIPRELRRMDGLSSREREVYDLMIQGRSNREIATTLFISESTTKVHVRHIFEKLKVHTRAEAVAANIRADV